jgi:hypothetical protein
MSTRSFDGICAARIVEKESVIRWKPIIKNRFQPARCEMLVHVKHQGVPQPNPGQRRAQSSRAIVCDQAAASRNIEPSAIVAKVPVDLADQRRFLGDFGGASDTIRKCGIHLQRQVVKPTAPDGIGSEVPAHHCERAIA